MKKSKHKQKTKQKKTDRSYLANGARLSNPKYSIALVVGLSVLFPIIYQVFLISVAYFIHKMVVHNVCCSHPGGGVL